MLKYLLFLAFITGASLSVHCYAQNDSVKNDATASADSVSEYNSSTTIDRKDSIQYFDQITQQPIFYERNIYDSTIRRIKKDEAYWYADQLPGKQKQEQEEKNRIIMSVHGSLTYWIVMIVVFVAALVWYLAAGNIRIFRKAPIALNEESELNYEEDLFTIIFESEIRKAINSNNYRLAIRLLFLRSLRQLNNNEIIVYKPTKTNADYLFQLHGSPYYKPFFKLTRIFDYVWYGKFQLDTEGFNELQKEFVQFNDQLQQ